MSRLKIQNSEFFEQNEILKSSFEKLEIKYEQSMENEEILLSDISKYKDELNRARDQCQNYEFEIEKLEHSF